MKLMSHITMLALALGVFCASSSASAQTAPAICDTPREIARFIIGVRQGRSQAQQAIARLGSPPDICDDLEAIASLQETAQAIVDDIVIPPEASDAVICQVRGKIAGLLAQIVELQEDCVDVCITDGEFIGDIAANLYCDLSIALGGLGLADLFERLATSACGTFFQDACDAQFEFTASANAACLPFITDPFDDVFALTQNNQCAYDPAPP